MLNKKSTNKLGLGYEIWANRESQTVETSIETNKSDHVNDNYELWWWYRNASVHDDEVFAVLVQSTITKKLLFAHRTENIKIKHQNYIEFPLVCGAVEQLFCCSG